MITIINEGFVDIEESIIFNRVLLIFDRKYILLGYIHLVC